MWRQDLIDLAAATDCFAAALGSGDESEQHPVPHDEREQVSPEFQQFTIEPKSVRFVAGDQTYAISGGVTGPAAAQTRIRVWLGDPATGHKLRDPTLGTETLVSGNSIVDLPGGYNVFSLVLEAFQLPANIPQPPDGAGCWVLTASAVGGEAESDPVPLPSPEYADEAGSVAEIGMDQANYESIGTPQAPIITEPPPEGAIVRGATFEIRGTQTCTTSSLLIEAWSDDENAAARPFATVLGPGETGFCVLVKLPAEGANAFMVRTIDLNSGLESPPVVVPSITRRQSLPADVLRAISREAGFP